MSKITPPVERNFFIMDDCLDNTDMYKNFILQNPIVRLLFRRTI